MTDFVKSNEDVYNEILDFLNVPRHPSVEFGVHNQSVLVKSKRARTAMYKLSSGAGRLEGLQKFIKRTTPQKARRKVMHWINKFFIYRPAPTLNPETRDALKRKVMPEVVKLQNLLGGDLVRRWGYDSYVNTDPHGR